jgi:hypothetical protein
MHLVDVEQLRVDPGHRRRLRLVVVVDELDGPTEEAALLVHVILPELHGQEGGLALRGEASGQSHAEADLDRIGGAGGIGAGRRDERDQEGDHHE